MNILKKIFLPVSIIILIIILTLSYRTVLNNTNKENIEDKKVEENKLEDKEKKATLTFVGDFLYEDPYYEALAKGDDENLYFSHVKKYFKNRDLSIGNMEVVIGNDTMEVAGGKNYIFCAPQSIGEKIVDLGMDVLATANNHANDRGIEGRISTLDFFANNSNILTVGTYRENERDISKNIKEVNGIKFGFLAYTNGLNIKVPDKYKDTVGKYSKNDTTLMKEEILNMRQQVDCLIVLMHWGIEFSFTPREEETTLARELNELGVDIIVGSHSHSIQPIEWIKGNEHDTLVYYSMGNFVSATPRLTRTSDTFRNAYQIGLLSNLTVALEDNALVISDISTEPIINYFDKDVRNFQLIPYSEYTTDLETTHYRYKDNFNKETIDKVYTSVIREEFRK